MWCKVLSSGLLVTVLVVPVAAGAAAPSPTATERTCRGETATIIGTSGADRLTGTRGPDVIVGLGGNDRIDGLAGDDVLCGNGGADHLVGSRGRDGLYGGRDLHEQRRRRTAVWGDLLEGGPGDDVMSAGFQKLPERASIYRRDVVSFRHSASAVTLDLGEGTSVGEGADVVVASRYLQVSGTRYDDVLQGSTKAEILDGGRGDDQVYGGAGRDTVLGYDGNDRLYGQQGPDFIISTSGVSTVDGGADGTG